jgi:hypothetical protein
MGRAVYDVKKATSSFVLVGTMMAFAHKNNLTGKRRLPLLASCPDPMKHFTSPRNSRQVVGQEAFRRQPEQ